MRFEQIFQQITPEEIGDKFNVFELVGKDFFSITAGKQEHYNDMVGSGGGFAVLFRKPTVWCILRGDRYTLELIEKEQTYTLSFFADEHKAQMLALGSKSGRDSEKMNETELTGMALPSGDMAWEEAKLIIECSLTAITTPKSDDFTAQEAKGYFDEAYEEEKYYRKYVYGEITRAWVRK